MENNELRVRVVKRDDKYSLQLYNPNTEFKMKIRNYGPYKTEKGAFRGAKNYINFFNYSLDQLDTEILTIQEDTKNTNIKRKTNTEVTRTEEWLDERYSIYQMENRNEDLQYYRGALKAVEFLGYSWKRNSDGKHTITKNKIVL